MSLNFDALKSLSIDRTILTPGVLHPSFLDLNDPLLSMKAAGGCRWHTISC